MFVVVSFINVKDHGNIHNVVFVLRLPADDFDNIRRDILAHNRANMDVIRKCFLRWCSICCNIYKIIITHILYIISFVCQVLDNFFT